jgi:hypothetical protein
VTGCGSDSGSSSDSGSRPGAGAGDRGPIPKRIEHVIVVVLENKSYEETFAADSPAPYLARELPAKGRLLRNYHGTTHRSLGNYLALLSGQAPTRQIQLNCPVFTELRPGRTGPDGQALGNGCVYPAWVQTLPDQLETRDLSWAGYFEDMGSSCRHPEIGAPDTTQLARGGDEYAVRHNPFVYFHSIVDRIECERNVVDLSRLDSDLKKAATTPSFAMVVPNLCHDGHDAPCVDGSPGGLESADGWLREWIPKILDSPAYAEGSLVVVTFDEGMDSDRRFCCGQPVGPNTDSGRGGGRVGAVLLSRLVKRGSVDDTPYNHYSLLRTIEDLFELDHLGYAGQKDLKAVVARP